MQGPGQDQAASKRSGMEAPSKMCPVKNMAFKSGLAGFMALNSFTLKKGVTHLLSFHKHANKPLTHMLE